MMLSERCSCGATLAIEDIRDEDVNSTVRAALSEFREGHNCPVSSAPLKGPVPF